MGQAAEQQAGRYAHARQYRRMQREIRKLRTWLGRVMRDVQRKAGEITGELKQKIETAQRLHEQRRDSKHKLYALHAPEVECIAKGKVRTPYEFGVKVSVAVTAAEGLGVDEHTMDSQLGQVEVLTGQVPKIVLADRGYRGVEPMIGHMKADRLLGRNWLQSELGDAMHAVLCGAGHNLRMILQYLRVLGWPLVAALAWLPLLIV